MIREHSQVSRHSIVSYVGNDTEKFAILFDLFMNGEFRVSQRAAGAVSTCAQKFPDLVYPYLNKLIPYLKKENIRDAIKRNILRILQGISVPKKQQGELMDICFRYLMNKKEPVAIRVFSMQILANLSYHYPEIRPEIRVIIEDEISFAKPGFVSRGRKILREFDKSVLK